MAKENYLLSRQHDYFNLSFLPLVIFTNIYLVQNLNSMSIWYYCVVFGSYMISDITWIYFYPHSVASPNIISLHHGLCIIGILTLPCVDISFIRWVALGGLTEVNTFLLIVKRSLRHHMFLEIAFLISWCVFRLIIAPLVFVNLFWLLFYFPNNILHYFIFIEALFFNLLNIKWTHDLIKKYKQKKDNEYHRL